ncbi:DUF262 domain-containing protein [Microbacterium capsulatum]|uniref:DUF262 domain-containing protein n=1 Tax=Microbacterium capsulatum TaxID=3041921 RepID=A0ABU0XC17_9MICO|nr:DUF262 domain-containing protein [Microbacterium sp. ASV81]MDQ4212657.1 DUF262 domain-containing protein [Microbacterium sp. ASV81]
MSRATNVEATAVSTIEWLSKDSTTIVVPVYQRQYRWDIGGCEQLLTDIRAVADEDDAHRHFIGSILSAEDVALRDVDSADADLVLIDGQQRLTTLMLLIAALHHSVRESDPAFAAELHRVLVRADDPDRTKLRPHDAWAHLFESVVLDRRGGEERESRFDDNYAFFRSQVHADEAPRIWRGLQRLEHVSITLDADANAQQIFESLNSTGEPLRDHELIHNYVLMGLSHSEQRQVEEDFWLPIERSTGEAIGAFWRHFLIMTTGREVAVAGEHGVYSAFRHEFPRPDLATLHAQAEVWREYSDIYRVLLDPSQEPDPEIRRQLAYVNTFGKATYPLVMSAYRDHQLGVIDKDELIRTLERIQSLLLRRAVVGVPTDRLIARLCRARSEGPEQLLKAFARITPSDERIRVSLKFTDLPHALYVLGRLEGLQDPDGFDVEYVVPPAPHNNWSGDGVRLWSEYSEDEQNSHRALASTLGNLALIEQPLAERVFGDSFPAKRGDYRRSAIAGTAALGELESWGTAAISQRTAALTDAFLRIWQRPAVTDIDDDGLTPILDAVRRRGWPSGWEREFDYVEYRGERWDVPDVKYLFNRVFRRGWTDTREALMAFNARNGGPIYEETAWKGQWDELDEDHHLYMGWDSKYMMSAVQGLLEESGLATEVFVKYSYIGNVM